RVFLRVERQGEGLRQAGDHGWGGDAAMQGEGRETQGHAVGGGGRVGYFPVEYAAIKASLERGRLLWECADGQMVEAYLSLLREEQALAPGAVGFQEGEGSVGWAG